MAAVDVSVIIPTYRREKQVTEAVRSALASSPLAVEVLVLDDSAEGSAAAAVASIEDPRVRYVKRREPSGGRPALARNEGAALARGEYLHFLDDDDLLERDALKVLVDSLRRAPRAGMAFGVILPFGENETKLRSEQQFFREAACIARRLRWRSQLTARLLFLPSLLVNSACMGRRDVFLACGGYDTEVPVCEDVDMWQRMARASDFIYVDRPVVRYRTGETSLMSGVVANDERLRRAYQRVHSQYRAKYGSMEFFLLKVWARTLLQSARF